MSYPTIEKGAHGPRPPATRRRYTVRDEQGIPLGHGRTPDEAIASGSKRGAIHFIEERDREYPFTIWHRVRVGGSA